MSRSALLPASITRHPPSKAILSPIPPRPAFAPSPHASPRPTPSLPHPTPPLAPRLTFSCRAAAFAHSSPGAAPRSRWRPQSPSPPAALQTSRASSPAIRQSGNQAPIRQSDNQTIRQSSRASYQAIRQSGNQAPIRQPGNQAIRPRELSCSTAPLTKRIAARL